MRRSSSRHHILFAVASPADIGSAAVRKVCALALALDLDIELFHCVFDKDVARGGRFPSRGVQQDIQLLIEERHQQLECEARKFRARGVRVRTSVRWDYPVFEGIVRQVLRHAPALLVVQSSKRSHIARTLFTATDFRLIETCPCPVLFIKTARTYSAPLLLAAVDPQRARGKPDSLDDEILKAAARLQRALSGQLQVFYAHAPWEEVLRKRSELRNVPEVEKNDVYSAYYGSLEERVRALTRRHDLADEQLHLVEGDPGEALTRYVNREKPEIVIVGAMARSWLQRALVGHTAERVLDDLDSDVLVVKASQFRSRVSRQSTHHIARSSLVQSRTVW